MLFSGFGGGEAAGASRAEAATDGNAAAVCGEEEPRRHARELQNAAGCHRNADQEHTRREGSNRATVSHMTDDFYEIKYMNIV